MGQIGLKSIQALNNHNHSSTAEYGAVLNPTQVHVTRDDVVGASVNGYSSLSVEDTRNHYLQVIGPNTGPFGILFSNPSDSNFGSIAAYPNYRIFIYQCQAGFWQFDENGNFIMSGYVDAGGSSRSIILMNASNAPTGTPVDKSIMFAHDGSLGYSHFFFQTENGDLLEFYKQSGLTSKDSSTVDTTYGSEESSVIQNNRTRIEEIETILSNIGFI